MTKQTEDAHPEDKKTQQLAPEKRHERKQRVLKHGATALVRSIASAVVVKNEDLFFLTEPDGRVPLWEPHGFGLYYHDCRFLRGYELQIAHAKPDVLASTATRGFQANFDLTNPDIRMDNGTLIRKEQIGIHWERLLDSKGNALIDRIVLQNFAMKETAFPISLGFQADFEDVMEVRGAEPDRKGTLHPAEWKGNVLCFAYDGADNVYRSLSVYFSVPPDNKDGANAEFNIHLDPRESTELLVSLCLAESEDADATRPRAHFKVDLDKTGQELEQISDEWMSSNTLVHCDSLLVNAAIERSLRDLAVLRTSIDGQEFFSAGVPWFVTLFGRDSIISALQTLAFNSDIAEHTLRLLAKYQGQRVDPWRDEEPGKILHELRVGEMAHLNEIPQTPYYGSVDATPLFLVLVAQHAAWTGDLTLFQDLSANVESALAWIDQYADHNGDGYVDYQSKSKNGLSNQGWKDSGDSVTNTDGSLAQAPIALVEVQGYVYLAKMGLAGLYERVGDTARAQQLRQQAERLRERFNHDYWMKDKQFFAQALEANGKQAGAITSNPGQALWTGIVDTDKAGPTIERLMSPDMFNEWGIRTLSDQERRYNPIGYHLGTVWPHDNSIIAAGFRRYGHEKEICRVFESMMEAAMGFRLYRLPELFAGFARSDYGVPVRYPVACHPQAWAAGTIPYVLESLLGLKPEAFEHRLRIVRPILPDVISHLEVHRLRVGGGRVDLDFERTHDGAVAVTVPKVEGDLQVIVEPTIPDQIPASSKRAHRRAAKE